MCQQAFDVTDSKGDYKQKHLLSLPHLGMLASSIIGTEGTTVFGQIYTLLTLEYLGVPTSLATANGFVGGCSAVFLIPLCGLLMDKGDNPKRRKLVVLGLSAFVFIVGFGVLFTAAIIKIIEGRKLQNGSLSGGEGVDQNPPKVSSTTNSIPYSNINQSFGDSLLSSSTSSDFTEPPPWIPVTGILGLVAFSLVDLAFDLGNSFSRAFALDHTPPAQHKVVLMMVSLLAPAAGALVSVFGILDLPTYLGEAFDVDGTAATLIFFAVFLTVVVISSTLCTVLTGLWVAKTRGFLLQTTEQVSPTDGLQMSDDHSKKPKKPCGKDSNIFADANETVSCPHCTLPYRTISKSSTERDSNGSKLVDTNFERIPLLAGDKTKTSTKRHDNICSIHKAKNFTLTPASELKDTKDCNVEPTRSKGREPYFFSKKLVILVMATYASMFSMVHFSMFNSNALTVGVFHGDPLASMGTEGKDNYVQGLRKSALGGTIFYISYFITSATNGKLVALIGERVIYLVSHIVHALTTLAFVYFQRVELFYASMATFGPFRWALFTVPYMMANEFTNSTMGSNVDDRKRDLSKSKAGRVVSIISVIGPINYLTSSASMGPLLAVTGYVWLPLILSYSAGFISALIFIPLFFMK